MQSNKHLTWGGGQPRTWLRVRPEQIRAFRAEHQISRYLLARALRVNATTIKSWELGTGVATPDLQATLAKLLSAGPDAIQAAAETAQLQDRVDPVRQAAAVDELHATGEIVAGYLASQRQSMTQTELVGFIQQVREALSRHRT